MVFQVLLELLVEIFAYSYDLWRPAGGCPGGAVRLWQARSAAAAPCPLWVGCQGLLQALEELAEALLDHSGCCCKTVGAGCSL